MEKLTLDSTIKRGKYANKNVSDLVNISGEIFSMIKDGYEFDDEVLKAAHIKKVIKDVMVYSKVGGGRSEQIQKSLPKETSSIKQILSELNTIDKFGDDISEDDNNDSTCYENEFDNINIESFDFNYE